MRGCGRDCLQGIEKMTPVAADLSRWAGSCYCLHLRAMVVLLSDVET